MTDLFLKGPDILDNRPSENVGNYGVDYTVLINTKEKRAVHLYFNPIGGEYSGIVEVSRRQKNGSTDVKRVDLPRNGRSMGYNQCKEYNAIDDIDYDAQYKKLKEMLKGVGEKVWIAKTFNCDQLNQENLKNLRKIMKQMKINKWAKKLTNKQHS